jgi:hypothetical protein
MNLQDVVIDSQEWGNELIKGLFPLDQKYGGLRELNPTEMVYSLSSTIAYCGVLIALAIVAAKEFKD